jgi:hypothetical protein
LARVDPKPGQAVFEASRATRATATVVAARVAPRNGHAAAQTNGHAAKPAGAAPLSLDELHRRVDAIPEPPELRAARLDAMVAEKAWPRPDRRVK